MNRERIAPGLGQESVWDYPRPARAEACPETRIRVEVDGCCIVDSRNCYRVIETSHPPVYYIPIGDILNVRLLEDPYRTWCEWKGEANYISLVTPTRTIARAGWFYPQPNQGFAGLHRKVAFYPSKLSACYVDEEQVTPQAGDFYGGWITSKVVGPFKGGPGTSGW